VLLYCFNYLVIVMIFCIGFESFWRKVATNVIVPKHKTSKRIGIMCINNMLFFIADIISYCACSRHVACMITDIGA